MAGGALTHSLTHLPINLRKRRWGTYPLTQLTHLLTCPTYSLTHAFWVGKSGHLPTDFTALLTHLPAREARRKKLHLLTHLPTDFRDLLTHLPAREARRKKLAPYLPTYPSILAIFLPTYPYFLKFTYPLTHIWGILLNLPTYPYFFEHIFGSGGGVGGALTHLPIIFGEGRWGGRWGTYPLTHHFW